MITLYACYATFGGSVIVPELIEKRYEQPRSVFHLNSTKFDVKRPKKR